MNEGVADLMHLFTFVYPMISARCLCEDLAKIFAFLSSTFEYRTKSRGYCSSSPIEADSLGIKYKMILFLDFI